MVSDDKVIHQPASDTDVWSEWLLHRRHADDAAFAALVRVEVDRYVERVLDAAQLGRGMTLLDIGAGEGLVGLRAIERVDPSLCVVMTDISEPMLRYAEQCAIQRGVRKQCLFLQSAADRLIAVADASVDAVTSRAALAYVADKPAALREFFRVLRPGGRISIAEPVLQDEAFMASALRQMIESGLAQTQDRFLPLLHRWKAAQYPDTPQKIAASPIANFSERNLFDFVRSCGFTEIRLELHIEMLPSIIRSWDIFVNFSPHPWAPSLRDILAGQFTEEERRFFEQTVRPIVESPEAVSITRVAFLSALKPRAGPSGGVVNHSLILDR